MKYRGLWLPLIILMFIVCIYDSAIATDFGPFQGKIVDVDTKAPIEGVVVLVEWWKVPFGMAGSIFLDAQETVTDREGNFYLSGIWVFKPWNRFGVDAIVTMFKSGYQAIGGGAISDWGEANTKWKGVIKLEDRKPVFALKKLTMEERRKQRPTIPSTEAPLKKIRKMLNEINKNEIALGAEPYDIWRGEKVYEKNIIR